MYRAVQLLDKSGNKCFASPYWPIGSIYLSFNDTNPATFFGGTWERLKGGFLYGCVNSAGQSSETGTSTGASSGSTGSYSGTSGSTAITVDQMPAHCHKVTALNKDSNGYLPYNSNSDALCTLSYNNWDCLYSMDTRGWSNSIAMQNTGGNQGHTHSIPSHTHSLNSHTHVVPYIAVFAWRRIA